MQRVERRGKPLVQFLTPRLEMLQVLASMRRVVSEQRSLTIDLGFLLPEVIGDERPRRRELLLRLVRVRSLRELDPRFVERDAQFQILAVGRFELGAQRVQPRLPGRELFRARSEIGLQMLQRRSFGLGIASASFLVVSSPCRLVQSLVVGLLARLSKHRSFALDRCFPIVEQLAEAAEMGLTQSELLGESHGLSATLLQSSFQLATCFFELFASSVEMILLKLQSVLHHCSLFVESDACRGLLLFKSEPLGVEFVLLYLSQLREFSGDAFPALALFLVEGLACLFERRGLSTETFLLRSDERCGFRLFRCDGTSLIDR